LRSVSFAPFPGCFIVVSLEGVIAAQKALHAPGTRLLAGHVHVELAGADQQSSEDVEILLGFFFTALSEPGVYEVAPDLRFVPVLFIG